MLWQVAVVVCLFNPKCEGKSGVNGVWLDLWLEIIYYWGSFLNNSITCGGL
jgi:hypothetical protein